MLWLVAASGIDVARYCAQAIQLPESFELRWIDNLSAHSKGFRSITARPTAFAAALEAGFRLPLRPLIEATLANNPDATADIEVLNEEFRDLPTKEAATHLGAAVQDWRATL